MPRFEFSAWLTVNARNEKEAKALADQYDGTALGNAVLSLDESEPCEIEEDD